MKSFSDYVIPRARDEPAIVIKGKFETTEADDDKHLVFGWASVAIRSNGEQIEDWDEDIIDTEDLEAAVYNYVEFYGEGGEMHVRGDTARMIESMMFTKEKLQLLGLPEDSLPDGWWIGFHVTDDNVWEKVKDGTYSMFSIEGTAIREEVEKTDEET